ncbi:hypothetical protein [Rhizobium sp. BK418]|uniref:hypothetical protein n=1 Tax=Rhizobium sp. BK418 TaxID=2512120 RepID=UPI00104E9D95|nr:hypothetical protein [Rhizobium sp. BK418]
MTDFLSKRFGTYIGVRALNFTTSFPKSYQSALIEIPQMLDPRHQQSNGGFAPRIHRMPNQGRKGLS